MTFTLSQTGLTASGTTSGGVTYLQTVLPALSAAGNLLVATMQTATGGTPFKCAGLATAPGNTAASAVGSGGSFAAGTYFWVVTATTAAGETTKSAEVSATVVLNGSASLTWGALPSWVTGVKVYRGTSATNEDHLIATLGRVTSYTDTGTTGSVNSPPNSNTAGTPNTSPGWVFCGLAAAGSVCQAEIWAYPNNPGGLSGATFTNAAGQACRGTIQEWSTTKKWQIMELFPGGAGAAAAAQPSVSTNGTVGSAELAVALLIEHFTVSPSGQSWSTPATWTVVNSQANNLATPWATYYKVTSAAGTVSITGNYSTSTNQNGNAAVVVAFREADSAAARVGSAVSKGTYTDQATINPNQAYPVSHYGSMQEEDFITGRTFAQSAAPVYQQEGTWPTSWTAPDNLLDIVNHGGQVCWILKPTRALSGAALTTEQGKMDASLAAARQAGFFGIIATLYNEYNLGGANGPFGNDTNKPSGDPYGTGNTDATAKANWLAYWANYAFICAQHGIPVCTKPSYASPNSCSSWHPPAGTVSGVLADFYYGDSNSKTAYLDQSPAAGVPALTDVCDGVKNPDNSSASNTPIPLGIGEWGRAGGSSSTVPWSTVVAWSHNSSGTGHVRDVFQARLNAGKANYPILWFQNNLDGPNWLHPSSTSGGSITPMLNELRACVDNLTVSAVTAGSPVITTTSPLPPGTAGNPYSASLAATGGTTPYTWSVTTGALPAGLVLNIATGQITGTPSAAGTTSAGFTVTDAASLTGSATLSVTIAGAALAVPAQTLPNGTQSAAYSTTLTRTGGTGPYTWAVTAGALPAGLTLTAATGSITGTPSAAGTSAFTAQVTDSLAATASRALSITIAAPGVVVTTTALPAGITGTAYTATLAASGGTGPYTWSVTSGTLPPGVALNTGGALSGTPSAPGVYSFTVQATDTLSATGSAALSISVVTAPAVVVPAAWRFLLAAPQPDGTILAEVAQAQSRTFTMRSGPGNYHEAAFDINGNDPSAGMVAELQADLQIWYGSQVLFCGRIGGTTDQLGASAYRLQPTAMDYRQVLRRRSLAYGGGPGFTAADIADIAWDLVQAGFGGDPGIQQYPGGDLGIGRGTGKNGLGIAATINYIRQDFAGTVIDNLCQLTPGSDWDITPYGQSDLRLDMWSPGRGQSRGVVLQWGDGQVAAIQRTVDPSAYANSVFVRGQGALTNTFTAPSAGALDAAGIAGRAEGRWDQVIGTQHTSQTSLDAAAAWYLNDAQVILPSYTITLHPGAWQGPGHIWLGDTVLVVIRAGRLDVMDLLPVTEMTFDIDASGIEAVTMTVGRVPFKMHVEIPRMLRRIRRLETQ